MSCLPPYTENKCLLVIKTHHSGLPFFILNSTFEVLLYDKADIKVFLILKITPEVFLYIKVNI